VTARPPINTGRKVTAAREKLGLSKTALGRILRLPSGRKAVQRMENDAHRIAGPVQLTLEALLSGWRPHDWKETNGKD
jgi:hypothetical protein